jgi:glycosyltransferase involved in cell wall biosynthesis
MFAVDLAEELTRRGRAIETVALVAGNGPTLDLPVLGKRPLGLRTLFALRRRARTSTLVIAHGSSAVVAIALATLGTRIRFIYRNIGDPTYWLSTPKRVRRMRWILKRASVVVALWEGSRDELRRVGGSSLDIKVIPNGVASHRLHLVAEHRVHARNRFGVQGLVAAYVGSLTPEKNVDAAIAAVASIPDANLLVVGDGTERERLENLADSRAPGRIVFTGPLADTSEALAATDVLVLPSHTEGMPGVLIEAAFAEVPVVATKVGGIPDIVPDGRSGFLVRSPSPDALRDAIRGAAGAGRAMGRVGRRWCASRFEIRVIADSWEALLTDLGAWPAT